MKGLGVLSMILLVLGILVLAGGLVLTVGVENNEYVREIKNFGITITPDTVKSVLNDPFLGAYLAEDTSTEVLALKAYAYTPTLYIVGGVMAGLGLLGLIFSPRGQRAKARPTAPTSSSSFDGDWF